MQIDFLGIHPGAVNFATPGIGTPHHLAGVMLSKMAGIQMTHVPYKGGGAVISDVIGGQVPLLITGVLGPLPFIKGGQLKALGVGSPHRLALLPNVPTIAEQGFPDFEAEVFFGAFLPAKTPPAVVNAMSKALTATLADPEVRKKLGEQALDVVGSSPEQLGTYFAKQSAKWAEVIQTSHVTLE